MTSLIVIGGGMSGLVCAVRAAELGAEVLLLEQGEGERYPCSARSSGGIFHVSYHDMKADPEELVRVLQTAMQGDLNLDVARTVAGTAGRFIDWLGEQGAAYTDESPIDWHRWSMAPQRPPSGGMVWNDWGPDLTLRALVARLAERGGRMLQGARVGDLIFEGGRCIGVTAATPAGIERFTADATVIADGGFPANPVMIKQYIGPNPDRMVLRSAGTARGDGIRMAERAGAALVKMDRFYGHLLAYAGLNNPGLWPYPQLDTVASAGLVVRPDGRRFTDEGPGGIWLSNEIAKLEDPAETVAIFDRDIWEGPGRQTLCPVNPNAVERGAVLHRADSIEELAAKAGLPVAALVETVHRYNAAVADGEADRLDPPHSPYQGRLWPILKPPFMAMPLAVGLTNTMGGIRIDGDCHALRADGSAIDGLYAIGSATGGLEGGGTIGYGGGLAKAGTLGLHAAEVITGFRRNA